MRLDLPPKGRENLNQRSAIALRPKGDLQEERIDPRKENVFAKETKLPQLDLRVLQLRVKRTCLFARLRGLPVSVENLKKLRRDLLEMTLSSTRRTLTLSRWDRRG